MAWFGRTETAKETHDRLVDELNESWKAPATHSIHPPTTYKREESDITIPVGPINIVKAAEEIIPDKIVEINEELGFMEKRRAILLLELNTYEKMLEIAELHVTQLSNLSRCPSN